MEELLLIPIQRFISGKKLSCDVFLHLPLNKKTIIVALAGQEVPEDFLKKILAKGYSHLGISKSSASDMNPDTFPLYIEGKEGEISTVKDSKEELVSEKKEEKEVIAAATAEPSPATPIIAAVPQPQKESINTLSTNEKKKPKLAIVPTLEEETKVIAPTKPSPIDTTTVSATEQAALEKTKIKNGPTETESATSLKADIGTILEEQKFSQEKESETVTKISGKNKNNKDESESHFSQDQEKEALNRVKSSGPEEEKVGLVKGKAQKIKEEESAFSTDEENPETVNRFSAEKEEKIDPPVTIFGAKDEKDDSMVFRLGRRIEEAKESLISGKKIDLSKDKELFLAGAEATLLSSKISEHIIKLSEQTKKAKPQEQISLRSQMRSFHDALQKAEKGEEVPAEIKKIVTFTEDLSALKKNLSQKDDAEQVIELSDRLSDLMEKREIATQAVEEKSDENKKQEKTGLKNRDLPATVSRLAAYLGYSLGYSDVNFLSDLSFGAIMQITQDESSLPKDLDPKAIPELVKAWKTDHQHSVLDDTRNILTFLQLYLNDPECDHSQKDFARKVFDRTTEQLMKEKMVNSWDLGKWSAFIERGLTMESHSICTRASAKALKKTRSIFS